MSDTLSLDGYLVLLETCGSAAHSIPAEVRENDYEAADAAVVLVKFDAAVEQLTAARAELIRLTGERMKAERLDSLLVDGKPVTRGRKSASRRNWDNDALFRDVRSTLLRKIAMDDAGEIVPVPFDEAWEAITAIAPPKGYTMTNGAFRSLDLDPDDYSESTPGYPIAQIARS